MSSSTTRVAPDTLFDETCDGGVRPAARWPASVRSRRPSWESRAAAASVFGSAFFPDAVRAFAPADFRRAPLAPAARALFAEGFPAVPFLTVFRPFAPVRAMAGN